MEKALEILGRLSEVLSGSSSLEQTLQEALHLMSRLVELESGWVWLKAREGETYYLAASWRLPASLDEPSYMTGKWCVCLDRMMRGDLPARQVTTIECSRLKERGDQVRYHASLPLLFGGRPLGVINLAGPEWRALTDEEATLLSFAARQIALAVERAHLADQQAGRVREQERLRLARDIHDHLAQSFTAIALQSEAALAASDEAAPRLVRILEISRKALDETRQSMAELRRGAALPERLRAHVQRFTYASGIPVSLSVPLEVRLSPAGEEELEAVVQEALRNVERHASARSVNLDVSVEDDLLRLTLVDDGDGFDPSQVHHPGRYGIVGMKERVQLLCGRLEIVSRPGAGTRLVVEVPL